MKLLKKQYLSHENINCTKKNDTIVIRRGDDNGFFLPGLHYVNKSFEKFSFIDIAFDLGKISNWRILLDEYKQRSQSFKVSIQPYKVC